MSDSLRGEFTADISKAKVKRWSVCSCGCDMATRLPGYARCSSDYAGRQSQNMVVCAAVCLFVCLQARMYVRRYVCVDVCMRMHLYVCRYVCGKAVTSFFRLRDPLCFWQHAVLLYSLLQLRLLVGEVRR